MRRLALIAGLLLCLAFSCMSALAFYARYFLRRDCFNEMGRCFDAETGTVYLQQAGIGWGAATAIFLALSFGFAAALRRERRT